MRIIAGEFKGRRLRAPDTDATRPVTDRVKESVFSSLAHLVPGARVADLYAGAGSFGLEALSRGAESVVFVENGRKAIDALVANLATLDLDIKPMRARVEDYLRHPDRQFDLVFCDPPWPLDSTALGNVLSDLRPWLSAGAIVVVTRRISDEIPRPGGYRIDDDRSMGDTRIIRYAKMESE